MRLTINTTAAELVSEWFRVDELAATEGKYAARLGFARRLHGLCAACASSIALGKGGDAFLAAVGEALRDGINWYNPKGTAKTYDAHLDAVAAILKAEKARVKAARIAALPAPVVSEIAHNHRTMRREFKWDGHGWFDASDLAKSLVSRMSDEELASRMYYAVEGNENCDEVCAQFARLDRAHRAVVIGSFMGDDSDIRRNEADAVAALKKEDEEKARVDAEAKAHNDAQRRETYLDAILTDGENGSPALGLASCRVVTEHFALRNEAMPAAFVARVNALLRRL